LKVKLQSAKGLLAMELEESQIRPMMMEGDNQFAFWHTWWVFGGVWDI
jgi:hypothetical protein